MSRSRGSKKKSKSSKSRKTPPPASTSSTGSAKTSKAKAKDLPYRTLGGGLVKPAIPIALVGPNGRQTPQQLALVDTGCDYSTFPKDWANQLGIDFDKDCVQIDGNTAGGATTDQRCYQPGISALCMGQKIDLYAIFNPKLPIALLGREDFLSYYKAIFDQRRKTFRLEPY